MLDAAAGDDDGLVCARDHASRRGDAGGIGLGPERRHPGELFLDDHLQIGLSVDDVLADDAVEIEMHRRRLAADRFAERLAQRQRQLVDMGDRVGVLGHRRERPAVVDLLIGVALLVALRPPPGHRDHRRAGEIGILQAGRQIGRADRLRHAHAGAPGDARIAVGHVGGGFFAMHHDAAQAELFDFFERANAEHRHEENVRGAVAFKGLGDKAGAGHLGHSGVLPSSIVVSAQNTAPVARTQRR